MRFRQAILQIDQRQYALTPNRSNSFDELYVDFRQEPPGQGGGERYHIFLHPKQDVTVHGLELQFEVPTRPDDLFFTNGFQSWSESQLLRVAGKLPILRAFARSVLGRSGDAHISGIPRRPGYLHAWTYTYFRRPAGGEEDLFFGSLSEQTGFTLLLYDHRNGLLTVRKDLAGLQLAHSFPALDLWVGRGQEQDLFDRYFQAMALPPPTAPPALGWTSWYRYFTKISAATLLHDLEQLKATPLTAGQQPAYFQIDDGWQTAVGDWQSVRPAFPEGMARLAGDIRSRGLLPGLWLAPFVASGKSELARQHPDWLLKDARGRPLRVGWNPLWGGWYHALDFYNGAVRDYLSGVFHIVLEKWGYELVKLDFLFAVCLAPPPGKTRGAVMHEAMEFLRRQVGTRRLLGCGVPLGSCFGLVDYCRIGGDMHMAWEHRPLAWLRHRERVSTLASLRSTLGRWQLNGRAFHNDPDVFILRDDHQKLSPTQQHTVLVINVLLGNLLFTSDDLGRYSPEQVAELEGALLLRGSRIRRVQEIEKDVFVIDFEQENERYTAFCNLTKQVQIAPAGQFVQDKNANGRIEIQPFETMVLLPFNSSSSAPAYPR